MAFIFVLFIFVVVDISTQDEAKRLISETDYAQQLHALQLEVQNLKTMYYQQKNEINLLTSQQSGGTAGNGGIYIRWGKTTCSNNATLVYSGFTAGSKYSDTSASAESFCLPPDPTPSTLDKTHESSPAYIYGAEYQFNIGPHLIDQDVPCAVCMSTTSSRILMIPGRSRCYDNWNEEYNGYLVGASHTHAGSVDFICMDESPDKIVGGSANQNGRVFHLVQTQCGSLKCPPYENLKILNCVVCGK